MANEEENKIDLDMAEADFTKGAAMFKAFSRGADLAKDLKGMEQLKRQRGEELDQLTTQIDAARKESTDLDAQLDAKRKDVQDVVDEAKRTHDNTIAEGNRKAAQIIADAKKERDAIKDDGEQIKAAIANGHEQLDALKGDIDAAEKILADIRAKIRSI